MNNMQTFEDYLKDVHGGLFPTLLDDDMPDHFDNWLGSLDGEEYMKYAQAYGEHCYNRGKIQFFGKAFGG